MSMTLQILAAMITGMSGGTIVLACRAARAGDWGLVIFLLCIAIITALVGVALVSFA